MVQTLNGVLYDQARNTNIPMLGNSTDTPITAAGGDFEGEWTQVPIGARVYLVVKADADLEFELQWSVDRGENIDSPLTRHYHADGRIEPPHVFTHARPWFRLVARVNGAVDPTYNRINTYTVMGGAELNLPLDGVIAQDYDATVVHATDYHTGVALGRWQGVETWNKFGETGPFGTGTSVIASWGGAFQFLTAGETVNITSADANDTLAGTGVQRIVVYGVDENWDVQTVVYDLNGGTFTTTEQWIGINRVAIFKAGSGEVNAGNITVTATTSGYTLAQMPAGDGVTQQMVFYVPRNHQFLAEWLEFNALKTTGGADPKLILTGWVYSAVNTARQKIYTGKLDVQRNNNLPVTPPVPFPIGEKSILWFNCETDTVNTIVSGRFSGELSRNKTF